jgi:riboflavin kinase/FMN adenylyltransferase
VPAQTLDGTLVSSTHIRTLLESGQMEEACRFLGHPHILSGEVVHGRQIGRTIGIPTANLIPPPGTVALRHGVYACMAYVDGKAYPAVLNVGSRPTVEGKTVKAEAWLLDFDGDLYGKTLTLAFYKFLRPEQKFASLDDLQAEIQKNGAQVRNFFTKN